MPARRFSIPWLAAVCLAGAAAAGAAEIGLGAYRFDPALGLPRLPAALAAATAPAGHGLHLVQRLGPVDDRWRDALVLAGAEVLDFVPVDAYLVWLPPGTAAGLRARPDTRALVPLAPGLKLTRQVHDLLDRPGAARLWLGLRAAGAEEALGRLAGLGAVLEERFPLLGQEVVRIELANRLIPAAAADEQVISISRWFPSEIEGEVAKRILDGSSGWGPGVAPPGYAGFLAARGVDGSGVTVAVIDNGVDATDPSGHLSGRVVNLLRGASNGSTGHGHHVAGIVAGDCAHGPDLDGYLWGSGVAPRAHLLNIPRLRAGYTGTDRDQVRDAVTTPAANGVPASIASCSWNAGTGTDYTMVERLWDAFVRDADDVAPGNQPLFLSFSAGNAGPLAGTITRPKAAKNVLVVGNSVSYRPAEGYGDFNEIFSGIGASSRGPAGDGRIRPDLVAPGTFVAAAFSGTLPNDCGPAIDSLHIFCTGTSMAQPHAAGAAALFTQWWRASRGRTPSPALLRAALVNGARDLRETPLGAPFSTGPVPNRDEGWGLIDLGASINPPLAGLWEDEDARPPLASSGEVVRRRFVVSDPDRPVRVTLAWTDAPAAVGADPALVNSLQLTVRAGATTWLGNGFRDGWSDPTVVTPDTRNNLQNVFVRRSPDAVHEVEVLAARLAGDGVTGNADPTDQDFALVVSNAEVAGEDGGLRLLGGSLRCDGLARIVVWDSGAASPLSVTVVSDSEPQGETVLLADAAGDGIFEGALPLDPAGAALPDGRLQIRDRDAVELRYLDADDGRGGIDVLKTASAGVDCAAPRISNVRVTAATDRSAIIEWDTDEPASSRVTLLAGAAGEASSEDLTTSHRLEVTGLEACGRHRFEVASSDRAGNLAVDAAGGAGHLLLTAGREPVFFTSFEGDGGGFEHWGPLEEWEWGDPLAGPGAAASGARCWGTDLDGKYAKLGRPAPNGNFLLVSPPLDLTAGGASRLRFRHWYDIASDGATDDGEWIEVWDGTSWTFVTPLGGYGGTVDLDAPQPAGGTGAAFSGESTGWREVEVDLQPFDGKVVRIKLHLFEEDSFLAGDEGAYLDDFEVFRFGDCEKGRIRFETPAAGCSGGATLEVVDLGLNADPAAVETATVVASSPLEPWGETVTLVETAPNSSRFASSVATASAAVAGDGAVALTGGVDLTARYDDADDGSSQPASRTASIPADCTPPALSGLRVTGVTDRSAIVEWRTDEPATSRVEHGPANPPSALAEDRTLVREHRVVLEGLPACARRVFRVASADLAGSTAVEDRGGRLHGFETWSGDGVAFADDFEIDRGWTLDGEWERGRPQGLRFARGASMDPNAAWSRSSVLGIDLSGGGVRPGDYEPGVALESAVTPPIDCSRLTTVELGFRRWLGVLRRGTGPLEDRAAIEVSNDGGNNWIGVWENPPDADLADRVWTEQTFDLTPWAAGRPDVRVRFTLHSDATGESMGWQIDDVVIRDPARPSHAPCRSALDLGAVTVDDSAGDGDGVAEPGETVTLVVRLANRGPVAATAVRAEATSGRPARAAFLDAAADFPDLPPGPGGADSLAPHLTLAISPAVTCGEAIPVTLALAAADSVATAAFDLPIGVAALRTSVVASPPLALAIPDPDPTGVAAALVLGEDLPLASLEVAVAISHPDAGDLQVSLTAPDGTTVGLHGFSGAGTPYVPVAYPTDRPPDDARGFASLLGRPLPGTWTLRAIDGRTGLSGSFDSWSLTARVADPASQVSGPVSGPLLLWRAGADLHARYAPAPGAVAHALFKSAARDLAGAVAVAAGTASDAVEPGGAAAPGSYYHVVRGLDACGRSGP